MIRVYVKNIIHWKSPNVYEASLEKLSPERKRQVTACVSMEDRVRRLGASLVLQEALEDWTGCHEPPVRFGYVAEERKAEREMRDHGEPARTPGMPVFRGKPYLKDYPDIHCNLSHSGEYVACAIGEVPVGIDIQEHRGMREKILNRYYCEDERSYVNRQTDERDRLAAFYQIWCRKEAYIKYTGLGMTQNMTSFSTLRQKDVTYEDKDFAGYSAALCYAAVDNRVEWYMEKKEDG